VVADRTGRPTLQVMPSNRPKTEQVPLVEPPLEAPEHTVTVTEVGADVLDALADGTDAAATLVLVAGPDPGQVFTVTHEMVIGRDASADIRIDDPAVSRQHARIFVRNGYHVIEDMGSSNGTLVSGTRVIRHWLAEGDRIQLGPRVVLRFARLDPAEERLQRQLFESATRDPLTLAYNKKHITERLVAEVAHARRHQSSLELVMFDLDKFKHINDHYGHLVGDTVLRTVADRVHALIRSEDVFGRFGGEEFALMSRSSDAARLAERIRQAIEQLTIPTDQGPLNLTVSLGVARLDEVHPSAGATGLLDLADQRLLRAKRTGRNRVCSGD
jgi:two-component system, cell cycle response regulator